MNIDEIMHKAPEERTADEIEFMIDWKVEQRLKSEEWELQEQMRQAEIDAFLDIQREAYAEIRSNFQRMCDASIAALERVEDEQKTTQ